MSVGYVGGRGPLRQAHPFTPLAVAASAAVLAFTLPAPIGPAALACLTIGLALREGVAGTILRQALYTVAPFWAFLFLLHAVIRDAPEVAVTVGARILAVVTAFLLSLATVHPERLMDGLVARRVPFPAAYLLTATLQVVPRLRARAGQILDAQRCRGLRLAGPPWRRARAIAPLAIPLVLSAISEVDDRAIALESRGMSSGSRRTPLAPPADTPLQRMVRWALAVAVLASVVIRLFR